MLRAFLVFVLALGLTALWLGLPVRDDDDTPLQTGSSYAPDGRYLGASDRPPLRPNLVLLVVDTLRADGVNGRANHAPDMPFLARLGQAGMTVENVVAPAVWTYPSLASLFTGLSASQHGVRQSAARAHLPRGVVTFAEALSRGHGYETVAFTDVELPDGRNSLLQGFQVWRSRLALAGTRRELERWAKRRDPTKPFWLLVHTFEAHAPYGRLNHPWPKPAPAAVPATRLPDASTMTNAALIAAYDLDWRTRRLLSRRLGIGPHARATRYRGRGWSEAPDRGLARRLEQAYRKGIAWVDSEVESTVSTLRRLGLLENTLLVVTGDHGEAFGEHGVLTHGLTVHDELAHVPLVATGPAPFDAGRRVPTCISLTDVLPTFFDLAGLPALRHTEGRSMLADLRQGGAGRAVLTFERIGPGALDASSDQMLISARTSTEKYIITCDFTAGTVVESLFDLMRDPGAAIDRLAATGQLARTPVSASLAAAIESARDLVYARIKASAALIQMGYAAGTGTLETRPPEPYVRIKNAVRGEASREFEPKGH